MSLHKSLSCSAPSLISHHLLPLNSILIFLVVFLLQGAVKVELRRGESGTRGDAGFGFAVARCCFSTFHWLVFVGETQQMANLVSRGTKGRFGRQGIM